MDSRRGGPPDALGGWGRRREVVQTRNVAKKLKVRLHDCTVMAPTSDCTVTAPTRVEQR